MTITQRCIACQVTATHKVSEDRHGTTYVCSACKAESWVPRNFAVFPRSRR